MWFLVELAVQIVYDALNPLVTSHATSHANVSFYYPLKTKENPCFSDVFRGYKKRPVELNVINQI